MSLSKIDKAIIENFEQYERAYPWRARLERFREHLDKLDKLPDQRRIIETESGKKAGPRVRIEREIEIAQQAGERGDLDHFAQALHRVIADFFEAGVPLIEKAAWRKQSAKGGEAKRGHRGELQQILDAIIADIGKEDAKAIMEQWKSEPKYGTEFDPISLNFDDGDPKPYAASWPDSDRANAWDDKSIKQALRRRK